MTTRRWGLLISALLLASTGAAARAPEAPPSRAVLIEHYDRGFDSFQPPERAVIRQRGCRLRLSQEEAQGWWRGALIVLLQKGPVVVASPADGLLAAPPYVALVEVEGGQTTLYSYFMRELYRDSQDAKVYAVQIDTQQAQTLCEYLLNQIVTQIRALLDTASAATERSPSGEQ